jgi:hypothetical protein
MNSEGNQTASPEKAKRLYSRKELSPKLKEETGVNVPTRQLEKYATTGGGPPYILAFRRAYYDLDEAIAWVQSRMSAPRSNTSEGRANAA